MSNVHLNEEQLQDYALAGTIGLAVMEHLTSCSHCQMQIRAYQTLYHHIREAETPLLDFNPEEVIPVLLLEIKAENRKDARYVYGLLLGAVTLPTVGVSQCWRTIKVLFIGIPPLVIIIGLLLLSGILMMQSLEMYRNYQKKLTALNRKEIAT